MGTRFVWKKDMSDQNWFILIYETADTGAQESLADQLRSLGSMTVETAEDDGQHIVIVENPGTIDALTLHELVMSFDPSAELIDTHKALQPDSEDDLVPPG
jgi:hypothetical protein